MASDSAEKELSAPRRRLSCSTCFNNLWFCYSPVHQMQQYYRLGVLDNCTAKWGALVDCLTLKTKSSSQVEGTIGTNQHSHFNGRPFAVPNGLCADFLPAVLRWYDKECYRGWQLIEMHF